VKSTILGLAGVIVIWGGIRYLYSYVISEATRDNSSCLVLEGSTTSEEDRSTYIVGSVRNNCDRRFLSVMVSFKLYPSSDDAIRTPMVISAHGSNLKPGESWQFKTSAFTHNNGYQLDSVRGY
jgi:hypothetical protein